MCPHLPPGGPAQRPVWTGFVLPTYIFTSRRAPVSVNATYSPLRGEGNQAERSERAKTTAGKTTVSDCCVKKAFNTARRKQILSFPRKMLPLPCIRQGPGPAVGLPRGRDPAASHLPSSHRCRARQRAAPWHSHLPHVCLPLSSPPAPSQPLPTDVYPGQKTWRGLAMSTELQRRRQPTAIGVSHSPLGLYPPPSPSTR